ncbi:MAG: type I restriction endonuclease [Bacteroidia bacterium]
MSPSFQEKLISQYPALALLVQLGYTYLTPEEALAERGGKTSGVLLEGILRAALGRMNRVVPGGGKKSVPFTEGNIGQAVQALKEMPLHEGTAVANQRAWQLLRYGIALEQVVEGDKKSHTLHYVDWEHPEQNARTTSRWNTR